MPDTKFSALTAADFGVGSAELGANEGGTSKKVTIGQIRGRMAWSTLGAAANNIPEIVLPGTAGFNRIFGHCFVRAPGAVVPRLRLGAASIDSGTNYATSSSVSTSTTAVTRTSAEGINLAHAALASGNHLLVEFLIVKADAAYAARIVWRASAISAAAGTAPTQWSGVGIWVNTTDLIKRIQLFGFTTLTGTTAANMDSGTELVVYGVKE